MKRPLLALLWLALASCSAEPVSEPVSIPPRPAGLVPLAQLEQTTPSPHLVEVVVDDDLVYVANSNDAFAIYELLDDGGLELILDHPIGMTGTHRCTTLALHSPTASLYCSSDEYHGISRFDVDDPLAPELDDEVFNPPLVGLRVHDLLVVGDRLLMARYEHGLASAQIGPGGRLSALREQPELGNLRKLELDASGRVWALSVDRGLLVLEPDPDDDTLWLERWQLEIDGPALGLGVEGSRAAIGLGSAGLAIVELGDDGLAQTHALRPPGVVTAADIHGDAALALTLQGPFVYDLREVTAWPEDPRGEQPREAFDEGRARLAGHALAGPWDHPGAKGSMLDGVLIEREGELELITSDWTWVERFAIDLDGFPLTVDLRRGEYLAAEAEQVAVFLRNPTPFARRVELQIVGEDEWFDAELEPRGAARVELPAERFEIDTPQLVIVKVHDGDAIVDVTGVTVLRRPPLSASSIAARGRPAPGQPFPSITLATNWPGDIEPLPIPTAGVRQRVVFYGIDCAAMWPQIEDLLWRVRSGRLGPEQVVLASHVDPTVQGAFDRWGLDDATWGYFAPTIVPPEIAALNPYEDLYEDGFVIYELPAAAHHPTDYVVDEQGRVLVVEREYRGEYGFDAW
ncbi:MAG: hypothetical protein R6X02_12805 [Enhygromyxa sp.]